MKTTIKILCCIAIIAGIPVSGHCELLGNAKKWGVQWKLLKFEKYRIRINSTGEILMYFPELRINSPTMYFKLKGRIYSAHHNLSGNGPWDKISGKVTGSGNDKTVEITGELADLDVRQTYNFSADTIIINWQAKVIAPTPNMAWIYLGWSLFTRANPAFTAKLETGKQLTGHLENFASNIGGLNELVLSLPKGKLKIKIENVRSCEMKKNSRKDIPATFMMWAKGTKPFTGLMPGDKIEYKITIKVEE